MKDSDFLKSFYFNEFSYTKKAHVDNSKGAKTHYIGYMKSGSGVLISAHQQLTVTAGDMFYIPKGCRYHSYWTPEGIVRFDSIGFDYFPAPEGIHYPLQKLSYTQAVWETFAPLFTDKTVTPAAIGILYTLLGLLHPTMERSAPEYKNTLTDLALQQMNADPNLSIGQIAVNCGVSEATLYNTFRRCLNKTPNAVRQEILCQKAAELLFTTSYTVEEICQKLNFSSPTYFRKVFESVYQKTPSQMRREENMI